MELKMKILRYCFVVCVFLACGLVPAFARGHGGAPPVITQDGIKVAALTHGQMPPMNDAYHRIMGIATTMEADPLYHDTATMAEVRGLMVYAKAERLLSHDGKEPGSLEDDSNPYHEPLHASLATAREILVRLNTLEGLGASAAKRLYSSTHEAMFANGAEIQGCAYSEEMFNTNVPVQANFGSLEEHQNTVNSTVLLVVGCAMLMLYGISRRYRGMPLMPMRHFA